MLPAQSSQTLIQKPGRVRAARNKGTRVVSSVAFYSVPRFYSLQVLEECDNVAMSSRAIAHVRPSTLQRTQRWHVDRQRQRALLRLRRTISIGSAATTIGEAGTAGEEGETNVRKL